MSLASAIAPLTPIFMQHFPYLHLTADEVVEMMRSNLEQRLGFKLPSQDHRPWLELSSDEGLLIWFEPVPCTGDETPPVNTLPPA